MMSGTNLFLESLECLVQVLDRCEREVGLVENKKKSLIIHCHGSIVDWIYQEESETLEYLEKKFGHSVAFKIEPSYHLEQYEIFD